MQNTSKLLIIGIIIVLVALGSTGYFYFQSSGAKKEIKDLGSQLSNVQMELAVLKATDLAKEAEILRLKLKNAETALATSEKKAAKLEENLNKIKLYINVVNAIDQFFSGPMTAGNLANIDAKVNVLNNSEVTSQWLAAKKGINILENNWSVSELVDTLFLINSKIRGLLL